MTRRLRFAAAVLIPLLVVAVGCGSAPKDTTSSGATSSTTSGSTPTPSPTAGACAYPTDGSSPARKVTAPPSTPVATTPTRATIDTNVGAIAVTLDADKTPCTVNSFLSLAKQKYFDGTTCHRLTTSGIFVLQCGDPTGTGSGTPGYSFGDELLTNDARLQPCQQQQTAQGPVNVCTYGPGTLAMANAGPNTNGSQFFLVYAKSPLPPNYTVFGHMDASGLAVVKKVARGGVTPTNGPYDGKPKIAVTITSVTTG